MSNAQTKEKETKKTKKKEAAIKSAEWSNYWVDMRQAGTICLFCFFFFFASRIRLQIALVIGWWTVATTCEIRANTLNSSDSFCLSKQVCLFLLLSSDHFGRFGRRACVCLWQRNILDLTNISIWFSIIGNFYVSICLLYFLFVFNFLNNKEHFLSALFWNAMQ